MSSYDSRRDSLRGKDFTNGGSFVGSGRRDLAGLTLDDVLGNESEPPQPPPPPPPPLYSHSPSQINRTLLDIIREEDPRSCSYKDLGRHRDRRGWKNFKDRLRLRRAGAAWTSSIVTPASDILFQNSRLTSSHPPERPDYKAFKSDEFCQDPHIMEEENTHRGDKEVCDLVNQSCSRPMMMRRTSTRYSTSVQTSSESDESDLPVAANAPEKASLRPQMMRHNSTRLGSMRCDSTRALSRSESSLLGRDEPYSDPDNLRYGNESVRMSRRMLLTSADDRLISAREAAAAQEAAEAEAAAAREEEEDGQLLVEEVTENPQPVRMSLMDLLAQTDGSSYMVGDEDDEEEYEEEEEVDEKGGEYGCSICMVRHKGAPSGPCGHSFCKLCSKELWVGKGNCPACNDFNQEIIEVF